MKRDTNWLNNRNQIKNPKLFNVTVFRDETGALHLLGNQTLVCNRHNNLDVWEPINTRAFGRLLNKQKVNFK